MPKQYEKIKDSELKEGKSKKKAEAIAAATYIKHAEKKGGKKAGSRAAKRLAADGGK